LARFAFDEIGKPHFLTFFDLFGVWPVFLCLGLSVVVVSLQSNVWIKLTRKGVGQLVNRFLQIVG
jgi:hypothetical protein